MVERPPGKAEGPDSDPDFSTLTLYIDQLVLVLEDFSPFRGIFSFRKENKPYVVYL